MSERDPVVFSPAGVVPGRAYSVEEVDDVGFYTPRQGKLRVEPYGDDMNAENVVAVGVLNPVDGYLINADAHVKHRWTSYLIFCSMATVMGSTFMFGYNAVIINEPFKIFQGFINQSYIDRHGESLKSDDLDTIWTLTVSLFLIGGTVGALLGGLEANFLGRRKALLIDSVIGLVGGIFMFIAPYVNVFELLLIGRGIAGIHCGLVSAIVPGYLTELAPMSLRGAAGTLNQLSIVTGGFAASIFGLPVVLAREDEPILWPFLFFPCVILPLLQIACLFFSVESPRWLLITRKDESAAFAAISKLRSPVYARDTVQSEIDVLRREKEIEDAQPALGFFESLITINRWPLLICVIMQLAQQLSGINAAIYYSADVFDKAGLEDPLPQYASLGVVGTTVVMTVVSIFVIERAGRRVLMLVGITGMWLACIFITIFMTLSYVTPIFNYLTIVCMFVLVAAFSIGPGPIPWFIAPELSLPRYRHTAITVCTFVNWIANLAVGFGFPPMEKVLGTYSFVPFLALLSIFLVFTLFFLPETRGRSAEESIHLLELQRMQLSCGNSNSLQRTTSAISNSGL